MGAQLDSLDIRRLQVHLLGRGEVGNLVPLSPDPFANIARRMMLIACPSNIQVPDPSVSDATSTLALQPAHPKHSNPTTTAYYGPRLSENEGANLRERNSLQSRTTVRPELPSTIPESLKDRTIATASQSQGSTQPVSQSVYEQFAINHVEQSAVKPPSTTKDSATNGTGSTAHTYVSGQIGHVDLLDVFEQPSTRDSAEDDTAVFGAEENDAAPQSYACAGDFVETDGLGAPKTPAPQSEKRISVGHLLEATPVLPKNPFANRPLHMGAMMDLSQVFKATQAPSSPVTNALTSDGISERPSPDMFHQKRPATADPVSSPAKQSRSMLARAVTEPQAVYISMKQSQEERERLRLQHAINLRNETADQEQSDDDFRSQESVLRRRLQRKRIEADARDLFVGVTAAPRPAPTRRGRGRGRGRLGRHAQPSPATRRQGQVQPEAVSISDDMSDDLPREDAQSNTTEDETELEDEVEGAPANCRFSLEEDNKENFGGAGIQVPMTTSRAMHKVSTGIATQPSPTAHRSWHISPVDANGHPVDNLLHGTSSMPKLDGRLNRSQPFAIADSQPSQSHMDTSARLSRGIDPTSDFASSPDSRAVILQSQLNRSQTSSVHLISPQPSKPMQRLESSGFVAQSDSHIPSYANGERPTSSSSFAKKANSAPKPESSSEQLQHDERRSMLGLTGKRDISQVSSKVRRFVFQTDIQPPPAALQTDASMTEKAMPSLTGKVHHYGTGGECARHVSAPEKQVAINSVSEVALSNTRISIGKSSHATQSFGTLGSGQPESRSTIPRSRSLPSESLAQRSDASSLFETAHTHVTLTHSDVLPLYCTVRDPEHAALKTFSQINTDAVPATEAEDIDVDFNLLTDADIEFQALMSQPGSVEPSRKRRRGPGGRAMHLVEAVPAPAQPDPLYSTQDREHDGQQAAVAARRYARDPARTRLETSFPVNSASRSSPSAYHMIESPNTTSAKRPPDLSPNKPTKSMSDKFQDIVPSKLVVEDSNVRRSSIDPSDTAKLDTLRITLVAPNRVFAHFNGKSAGYYPATCLGVVGGEEPRFKVRFDDGTIDVINPYGVKRLELRQGDTIKLNLDGARTKNYTVVELKDKQRTSQVALVATPSRKAQIKPKTASPYPITDIYGYTSVIAELKQREVPGVEHRRGPRITASLQDVYLTQTMWTGFKDRQYTRLQSQPRIMSGLLTPSERPSTPATPSSRNRRNKKLGLANLRLSTSSAKDGASLFENMAFGISNIPDDTNRDRTTRDILTNGGRILKSGFDELFQLPAFGPATPKKNGIGQDAESELRLKPSAESLGFTCLLADKYCRSHKFIQALAAGIPCLATRWVQDCVAKQRILAWEPYLLPAGESEYLGSAVKSRVLQSFPTQTARLATIVSGRPTFLKDQTVLLIMSKSEEDTMSAHPFITHALGARKISRAHSLDAAAKAVAEAQANGEPWDWVYSHKKEKETEGYLFGAADTGKKRKRGRPSGGTEMVCEKGKTRVVGNNFVIQSLILGQLMDVD